MQGDRHHFDRFDVKPRERERGGGGRAFLHKFTWTRVVVTLAKVEG